jgi:hypothetical protein
LTVKKQRETAIKHAKYLIPGYDSYVSQCENLQHVAVYFPIPSNMIEVLKRASQRMGIEHDGIPSDTEDYAISAFLARSLGLTHERYGEILNNAMTYGDTWVHPNPRARVTSNAMEQARIAGYNEARETAITALMSAMKIDRQTAEGLYNNFQGGTK